MGKTKSSNPPNGRETEAITSDTGSGDRLAAKEAWQRLEHVVLIHQNPRADPVGKPSSLSPQHLLALVQPLLWDNRYEDGKVRIARSIDDKRDDAGPLRKVKDIFRALTRDEDGRGPGMQIETASRMAHRLLGLLPEKRQGVVRSQQSESWIWPVTTTTVDDSDAREFRKLLLGVHAEEVLTRFESVYQANPVLLSIHVDRCMLYLRGDIEALPNPLHVGTVEQTARRDKSLAYYRKAHDCIVDVLSAVSMARNDVTFVGAAFSISVHQGAAQFSAALARGVRLRFLVFDFMRADPDDVSAVAKELGLSFDSMRERFVSTLNTLLELRSVAQANSWPNFELRLLSQDPGMRRYIVDQNDMRAGQTFYVPRVRRSLDIPALAISNEVRDVVEQIVDGIQKLWDGAAQISDDWVNEYRNMTAGADGDDNRFVVRVADA